MTVTTHRERTRHRLTIREVADLAGVSTATVSRVINGRAEVSEKAREAVLRVVREHGYSTNRTRARPVGRAGPGLVGVTLPVVHHSYFSVILDGAGEALYEQDMRMVLCPTHHEHEREVSLLERLMHGTTDGALLILPEESGEELPALHRARLSRSSIVDPLQAARRARPDGVGRPHLRRRARRSSICSALGHRRIAAITGPRGWIATEERLRGYRAALAAAGVMPDPELVVESDFHVDGGRRGGRCAARPARSADRDLRLQRHARDRRHAGGAAARASHPGGALGGRLRRHVRGLDRHAAAHHRAPAAGRDGPDGGEPARPAACRTSGSRRCTSSSRPSWSCANRPPLPKSLNGRQLRG